MIAFLSQDLITLLFPIFFMVLFIVCMGMVVLLKRREKSRTMVQKIKGSGFADASSADVSQTRKRALPVSAEPKSLLSSFFSLFSGKARKKDADIPDPADMRLKFLQAGIRSKNFDATFFGAKLFLPVFFVCMFLILKFSVYTSMTNTKAIIILVFLGLLGFYLPDIWLKQKTDKRKIVLFKALPDALDLLVVCVEAGMGLDAALLKVGQEIEDAYPDLAREFAYLNLEIRAGKQRADALRNLYQRTGIEEMNSLVTLLIQTDRFGTSVSKALQVFSESFRTKRYQMAEELAAKLPVKILIPLLIFIFPALFVIIIGPAAISIYQTVIKGI